MARSAMEGKKSPILYWKITPKTFLLHEGLWKKLTLLNVLSGTLLPVLEVRDPVACLTVASLDGGLICETGLPGGREDPSFST